MTGVRTTRSIVRFEAPFKLACFDEALPAGTYDVDTEEEIVEGNQRNVFVRIATSLHFRTGGMMQILPVNPQELQAAITVDAGLPTGDSFGPPAGGARASLSHAASERDLGSVGAVEVAPMAIGTETLRIVQAMQHEELNGIVHRIKGGLARGEIEHAAVLELKQRRGPNS